MAGNNLLGTWWLASSSSLSSFFLVVGSHWPFLTCAGYGEQQLKLRDLCKKRSCYPATGNLLIGREDKLSANSTCGTESQSRYCIISSLDIRSNQAATKCHYCDATDDDLAHNVNSIVHKMEPPDAPRDQQKLTWWQAPNGRTGVTITLNLEAEFHVTHVIITFKTFR